MKFLLPALPLLFALTSCDQAKVKASEALDGASQALSQLADSVEELDLSGLSPEAIGQKGRELAEAAATQLGEIRDSETARRVVTALEPVVDKLHAARELIGEHMPSMAELQEAALALEERVAGDEGLRGIVQPLIEKIERLGQ